MKFRDAMARDTMVEVGSLCSVGSLRMPCPAEAETPAFGAEAGEGSSSEEQAMTMTMISEAGLTLFTSNQHDQGSV